MPLKVANVKCMKFPLLHNYCQMSPSFQVLLLKCAYLSEKIITALTTIARKNNNKTRKTITCPFCKAIQRSTVCTSHWFTELNFLLPEKTQPTFSVLVLTGTSSYLSFYLHVSHYTLMLFSGSSTPCLFDIF